MNRGFSLMELMITLAVAAILIMVAVPSYMNYVTKSRRNDAKTSLLEISQLQENHRGDNNEYTADIKVLCRAFPCNENYQASLSKEGFYTLVIDSPSPSSFTIRATPVADKAQAGDTTCTEFSIDQFGKKGATNSECW